MWFEIERLNTENEQLILIRKDLESQFNSELENVNKSLKKSKAETEIIRKEYDSLWSKIASK